MSDDPDLDAAYGLSGPEGSKRLYASWAKTYDTSFAEQMHYRSPQVVAEAYARLSGAGPVLDLGAGTGLVGEELARLGVGPIHGTDISPEMLAEAGRKGVYAKLFEGDLTAKLDVPGGTYAGAVSAGTFTNGHVGPEALSEVLRCMASGAVAALSVSVVHWQAMGFDAALAKLDGLITDVAREEFAFYGADATGDHAKDTGWLLSFRKS